VGKFGPDAVVLDLEDSVAPADKDTAREAAFAAFAQARPDAPMVLVRINPPGSPWHGADAVAAGTAIESGAVDGVVLPKYEDAAQLEQLRQALPPGAGVIVGLESAVGIAGARTLLAEGPDAAYFGSEDFAADVGARRTPGGLEVLYARSEVVLACRLHDVLPLDQAVVAVKDDAAFRADATAGRDLGYRGKICLHPTQVAIANEIFVPSAEEVAHARAVLDAAAAGVGMVDGVMVDAAHMAAARRVIGLAVGEDT
jgi:citrate lyase subunit beta/citryl-CoA lyase